MILIVSTQWRTELIIERVLWTELDQKHFDQECNFTSVEFWFEKKNHFDSNVLYSWTVVSKLEKVLFPNSENVPKAKDLFLWLCFAEIFDARQSRYFVQNSWFQTCDKSTLPSTFHLKSLKVFGQTTENVTEKVICQKVSKFRST